jgi:DNA polymerase I
MEIELLPAVSLLPETLSVLVAPEEMLARALNGNPHLQQFRILFITGIRSGILSRLDRSSMELDVRRAFTSVQLGTILEENHHSFLLVEHNPLLYERARDMAGRVAQAMKQASREATILYAPALDRHLEAMAELADRVFCFYDMQGQAYGQGRSISEELASQTTWEAFS